MKPYKFAPYLKTTIWGGYQIAPFKGIYTAQPNIGESWEISAVPGHESIAVERGIIGDVDLGLNLAQLIDKYKGLLVGERVYKKFGNQFPLLVKFIDSRQDLSVQVHPDDKLAMERHGCMGKTEMWYVLDAAKDTRIVYGLSRNCREEEIRAALKNGNLMNYLNSVPARRDDLFFIEPGTIHAIGAGALVAEIQESSNLTYRLYDYDRADKDGKKRPLHVEKALAVASLAGSAEPRQPIRVLRYRPGCARELLCRCRYFEVYRMILNTERRQRVTYRADAVSFRVLLCVDGCGSLSYDGGNILFYKGDCILVPAESVELTLHGKAQFLDVRG